MSGAWCNKSLSLRYLVDIFKTSIFLSTFWCHSCKNNGKKTLSTWPQINKFCQIAQTLKLVQTSLVVSCSLLPTSCSHLFLAEWTLCHSPKNYFSRWQQGWPCTFETLQPRAPWPHRTGRGRRRLHLRRLPPRRERCLCHSDGLWEFGQLPGWFSSLLRQGWYSPSREISAQGDLLLSSCICQPTDK